MTDMKKALITGSSGFIGTHLKKLLKKNKVKVVSFDRKDGFELTKPEQFKRLPKTDVVFHLGAVSGYKDSNKDIKMAYEVNLAGTVNVLEYCRRVNAKCMFPSTYVYDKPHKEYKKEVDKTSTSTHYAHTKLLGERLCQFYSRIFKVNTLIMRTSNVYGLGQDDKYIVPVIVNYILKDKPLILTKPEVERTYIHVSDVVTAYFKLAQAKTKPGEIFNVAGNKPTSLNELVNLIKEISKKEGKVDYTGASRPNDVDVNRFDISKIRKEISWKPEVSLKDGLTDYIQR